MTNTLKMLPRPKKLLSVDCTVGSRYKAVGESGIRVGCPGLDLDKVRCVGFLDSDVMVH